MGGRTGARREGACRACCARARRLQGGAEAEVRAAREGPGAGRAAAAGAAAARALAAVVRARLRNAHLRPKAAWAYLTSGRAGWRVAQSRARAVHRAVKHWSNRWWAGVMGHQKSREKRMPTLCGRLSSAAATARSSSAHVRRARHRCARALGPARRPFTPFTRAAANVARAAGRRRSAARRAPDDDLEGRLASAIVDFSSPRAALLRRCRG